MTRLRLLAHASTAAVAEARFPLDEPLSARGLRELGDPAAAPAGSEPREPADHMLAAPEARARATAHALGMDYAVEGALREIDYAAWAGRTMERIDEKDLAAWLTDPAAAPHGGESVQQLLRRVGTWLDSVAGRGDRVAAVTHQSVMRAAVVHALGAPADAFWRIEVRPLGAVRMTARGGRWTVRVG